MVDRHAVKQMLTAGLTNGEVARHFGISTRTVRRISAGEPAVEDGDDRAARRARGLGRPGIGQVVRDRAAPARARRAARSSPSSTAGSRAIRRTVRVEIPKCRATSPLVSPAVSICASLHVGPPS